MTSLCLPSADAPGFWLDDPDHRAWLMAEASRQFAFFRASLRPGPGFHTLDFAGEPLADDTQELHTTPVWCIPTRLAIWRACPARSRSSITAWPIWPATTATVTMAAISGR